MKKCINSGSSMRKMENVDFNLFALKCRDLDLNNQKHYLYIPISIGFIYICVCVYA